MASIINKAKAFTNSPKFQKKVEQKTDAVMLSGASAVNGKISQIGLKEAANKFIEVLQNEVQEHSDTFGSTAISAITQLECDDAKKIGKNKYQIPIWFSGDLHRDSLVPKKYTGIDNIVALLNNGYKADGTVYGIWQGHSAFPIYSLPMRDGTHFIDSAVRSYMSNYAKGYNVTDITVDEIYK